LIAGAKLTKPHALSVIGAGQRNDYGAENEEVVVDEYGRVADFVKQG
jgi:hypothetical protein